MFANSYREDELSTNLSYAALTMKLIFQFLRFLSKNMFRKQIDEISVGWFDGTFLFAIIPFPLATTFYARIFQFLNSFQIFRASGGFVTFKRSWNVQATILAFYTGLVEIARFICLNSREKYTRYEVI